MLTVIKAGVLTTVQDKGRFGAQHAGVGPAGPADWVSHAQANLAVGNALDAPALELSGGLARFQADVDLLMASAGAELSIDGAPPLPALKPVRVAAGQYATLQPVAGRLRSYLAVAGGVSRQSVLGSASWNTAAGLGTYSARGLAAGDRLATGTPSPAAVALAARLQQLREPSPKWRLRPLLPWTDDARDVRVRVVRDRQGGVPDAAWAAFVERAFAVDPQSNRMGLRLKGEALPVDGLREMASRGVTTGTIQLPTSGLPLVLLSDRQTVGGYPVLGTVATADLPVLTALQPGRRVRFEAVTAQVAQEALLRMQDELERLRWAVESAQCRRRDAMPDRPEPPR